MKPIYILLKNYHFDWSLRGSSDTLPRSMAITEDLNFLQEMVNQNTLYYCVK